MIDSAEAGEEGTKHLISIRVLKKMNQSFGGVVLQLPFYGAAVQIVPSPGSSVEDE